ncbi:MAG: S-layer homology domain-containing protein, partial [Acidobacteria bacterium]|nr:S-layer homology domain-containing protein [Acidobacteriota bacterium]
MSWKTIAASALAFAMAGAVFAQRNPFTDVPRTHWAYSAIQRAVDAGVLEGYDGKFHGEKLINRYQMAVIIKRILDNFGKAGGPSAAGMSSGDVKNLEAMMIEFADELALLNVKVSTL